MTFEPRKCAYCGKEYMPITANGRYCCRACQQKASHEAWKQRRRDGATSIRLDMPRHAPKRKPAMSERERARLDAAQHQIDVAIDSKYAVPCLDIKSMRRSDPARFETLKAHYERVTVWG